MDKAFQFDWGQVNLFVAVADTGSLSGAARKSGVSQPTIGRAIQSLEDDLGVTLFSRHARGLHLTEEGEGLLVHARLMAEAAARLSLAAAGSEDRLEGVVRISASQVVATYLMPAIIARMRRDEPRIQIELVATDTVNNLLFREADIAIRMVRPTQDDLYAKQIGMLTQGAYASHAYLAQVEAPRSVEDMMHHTIIGYDTSNLMIEAGAEMGIDLQRSMFAVRCDDQVVCLNLMLAGAGIGFGPRPVCGKDARLERVMHGLNIPSLPVWIVSHEGLKTNPRVRFVNDYVANALSVVLKGNENE